MKPPQTPVRPPPPSPVPVDDSPAAGTMVATPRSDAAIGFFRPDCPAVPYEIAQELERELKGANRLMSLQAWHLMETVNDRNRLGVQLDLIRDELQRIWARVMESGHADHPSLSSIKVYCERAQKDIEVNYTPIQERDKLSKELTAANQRIAELEAERNKLIARVGSLELWIHELESVEANPSQHRRWCGDPIGWLNPGHAVFVGKDKPEGLR